MPGAANAILHTLEAYGFEWDGAVMCQGRRGEAYQAALDVLIKAGRVYGCTCSRKTLATGARRGVDGFVYPGVCRGLPPSPATALRLVVPDGRVVFQDALLGRVACDVARECGDFVLKRADGVFTYQLAVVVDDMEQGITHVVRGADLLASTPRQVVLQTVLGYPRPVYKHLPIVLDEWGLKLSKQTLAAPLDDANPLPALLLAGGFLGMKLKPVDSVAGFWAQARQAWGATRLSPVRGRCLSPPSCS